MDNLEVINTTRNFYDLTKGEIAALVQRIQGSPFYRKLKAYAIIRSASSNSDLEWLAEVRAGLGKEPDIFKAINDVIDEQTANAKYSGVKGPYTTTSPSNQIS